MILEITHLLPRESALTLLRICYFGLERKANGAESTYLTLMLRF